MPPNLSNRSRAAQDVFALSQTLLTALYPPRCAGCDAFCETLFCAPCRATLQSAPPLSDSEAPREYSLVVPERDAAQKLSARAALLFDGALREAIHHFKYEGRTALAAPLAQLMLETLRDGENKTASTRSGAAPVKTSRHINDATPPSETAANAAANAKRRRAASSGAANTETFCTENFAAPYATETDDAANPTAPRVAKISASTRVPSDRGAMPIFVPIPLHAWRKWRRGYNQSELLARELARLLGAPCVSLLRRTRYTVTQTELSREERTENVRGAFALNENAARVLAMQSAREIVLIDDVYTTGATLYEAARVLHDAFPAAKLSALTLAYQPPS